MPAQDLARVCADPTIIILYFWGPGTPRTSGTQFMKIFFWPTPSMVEDLMPWDIMSSEPMHWMLFGQLVMAVRFCAKAYGKNDKIDSKKIKGLLFLLTLPTFGAWQICILDILIFFAALNSRFPDSNLTALPTSLRHKEPRALAVIFSKLKCNTTKNLGEVPEGQSAQ